MQAESKGPWAVHSDSTNDPIIVDAMEATVAHVFINDDDVNKANARRIVAVLNACEGVDTETLEQSPDLASAFMSANNAKLIQQKNSLLAALKVLKDRYCDSDEFEASQDSDWRLVNAAIAKAEAK
jgi:hypothetical protein